MKLIQKSQVVLLSLSFLLPYASTSFAQTGSSDSFATLVNNLEQGRKEIFVDYLDKKAPVRIKDVNFQMSGDLSGHMEGGFKQYSPLSSMVVSALFGAALGGLTGGALALPAAGALAGGTTGAAVGPFIPTGNGSISGQIEGHVKATGYKIYDKPVNYGLGVLDPSIVNGLTSIVQQYPNAGYTACTQKVITALQNMEEQGLTVTPQSAEDLLVKIDKFNDSLEKLRSLRAKYENDFAQTQKIDAQIAYYESYANRKLAIVNVGGKTPIIDRIEKLVYRDTAEKIIVVEEFRQALAPGNYGNLNIYMDDVNNIRVGKIIVGKQKDGQWIRNPYDGKSSEEKDITATVDCEKLKGDPTAFIAAASIPYDFFISNRERHLQLVPTIEKE